MSTRSYVRGGRSVRRLGGLLALGLLALLMGGCAKFLVPPTATQLNVMGDVRVSSLVCLDGFGSNNQPPAPTYDPNAKCTPPPKVAPPPPPPGYDYPTGQMLIGYLIPDGATVPSSISSVDFTGVNAAVALHQDSAYGQNLTDLKGVVAGSHWVGYVSDEITLTAPLRVHVNVQFGLPSAAPFTGPFATQEVVGDRGTGGPDGLSPGRPVDCSGSEQDTNGFVTTDCAEDATSLTVPTRDLAVERVTPPSPSGAAGTTIAVPFKLAFRGAAAPFASFALTASTDLAGASATSADSSLTPATDSLTAETVNVAVPASATPGTYHATLTATVSGETRTGTMSYTVTAAQPPPPPLLPPAPPVPGTVSSLPPPPALPRLVQRVTYLEHPNARHLLRNGIHMHIGCNQSCSASIDLVVVSKLLGAGGMNAASGSATATLIGRTIVNLPAAGTKNVTVKLFALPRAVLRHLDRFTLTIRTSVADRRGLSRTRPAVRRVAVSRRVRR